MPNLNTMCIYGVLPLSHDAHKKLFDSTPTPCWPDWQEAMKSSCRKADKDLSAWPYVHEPWRRP